MQQNGHLADTALLHGMGNAYGIDVLIFQVGTDPACVGTCLHLEDGSRVVVPVALVNDYHFWGLLSDHVEEDIAHVDKGDIVTCGISHNQHGCVPGQVHNEHHNRHSKDGKNDMGEDPAGIFLEASPHLDNNMVLPGCVEKELALCQVLSTWCPWATPSNQLLQAMAQLQGQGNIGSDIASMCMARAAAI